MHCDIHNYFDDMHRLKQMFIDGDILIFVKDDKENVYYNEYGNRDSRRERITLFQAIGVAYGNACKISNYSCYNDIPCFEGDLYTESKFKKMHYADDLLLLCCRYIDFINSKGYFVGLEFISKQYAR